MAGVVGGSAAHQLLWVEAGEEDCQSSRNWWSQKVCRGKSVLGPGVFCTAYGLSPSENKLLLAVLGPRLVCAAVTGREARAQPSGGHDVEHHYSRRRAGGRRGTEAHVVFLSRVWCFQRPAGRAAPRVAAQGPIKATHSARHEGCGAQSWADGVA